MSNFTIKAFVIAILVTGLFGCGGESDEAKKLGFSSVEEMKEVHSKGWHTKQKYLNDNPKLASAASTKNTIDALPKSSSNVDEWKDFSFSNQKFSIKYPANKADASYSTGFRCESLTETVKQCHLMASSMQYEVFFGPTNGDEITIEDYTSNIEQNFKLKKNQVSKVSSNGLALSEVVFNNLNGETSQIHRVYLSNTVIVALRAVSKQGDISKSKDDVFKFLNSFSETKRQSVESTTTLAGEKFSKVAGDIALECRALDGSGGPSTMIYSAGQNIMLMGGMENGQWKPQESLRKIAENNIEVKFTVINEAVERINPNSGLSATFTINRSTLKGTRISELKSAAIGNLITRGDYNCTLLSDSQFADLARYVSNARKAQGASNKF